MGWTQLYGSREKNGTSKETTGKVTDDFSFQPFYSQDLEMSQGAFNPRPLFPLPGPQGKRPSIQSIVPGEGPKACNLYPVMQLLSVSVT